MKMLKRLRLGLARWMQANARAHAAARPSCCCGAPPAGAGRACGGKTDGPAGGRT